MKLLNRIAHSNGDLQRTVLALRLINQHLQHELSQLQVQVSVKLRPEDFAAYFDQLENQPENPCPPTGQVELRCEHLDAMVNATTGLLRPVIEDSVGYSYVKDRGLINFPISRLHKAAKEGVS